VWGSSSRRLFDRADPSNMLINNGLVRSVADTIT
jgi:hypothetical protein